MPDVGRLDSCAGLSKCAGAQERAGNDTEPVEVPLTTITSVGWVAHEITNFAAMTSVVPVATGPTVVPTTDAPPSAVPQTAAPAPCTSGGIQEFGNCYYTPPAYAPAGCAAGVHCREQNPWAVTTLALTGWWLCTTPPDGGDYDASRCDAPLGIFGGVSEVNIFRHGRGEEDGIVEFRCEDVAKKTESSSSAARDARGSTTTRSPT
ncbi:hypothetical protein DIPPA_20748 [Diplonema papillatum]|nr:hypothetical protein DIPPA_20748 [Diplonema papillatum]